MAKHALCIGINNYPGTDMDLSGCVNDADDWAAELTSRGYAVQKLLDATATRAAMVDGIRRVLGDANAGDTVVITFSGHGTVLPDRNGDEAFDQGLCPYDLMTAGALVDDDIRQLIDGRKPGVQFVLLSDSCHSGSVTRAPDAAGPPRARFMPPARWLKGEALARYSQLQEDEEAEVKGIAASFRKKKEGDLLISGCEDGKENYSYDASFNGRPNGAFTWFALDALKNLAEGASYEAWHAAIRKNLPSGNYPQAPQLVAGAATRKRAALT